jgi:hypothetical protein
MKIKNFIIIGTAKALASWQKTSNTIAKYVITTRKSNAVKSLSALNIKPEMQVTCMCRSAWYHLYPITKIRHLLTSEQTKHVIHAYVTSAINLRNSLFIGIPQILLNSLQYSQNHRYTDAPPLAPRQTTYPVQGPSAYV